jgi:hypothetical protein
VLGGVPALTDPGPVSRTVVVPAVAVPDTWPFPVASAVTDAKSPFGPLIEVLLTDADELASARLGTKASAAASGSNNLHGIDMIVLLWPATAIRRGQAGLSETLLISFVTVRNNLSRPSHR